MILEACATTAEAEWVLGQERDWGELTARGPLGFESYARLRFIPDPAYVGQREADAEIPEEIRAGPTELWQMGVAVSRLLRYTTTPGTCYFLIWEGWPDVVEELRGFGAAQADLRGAWFDSTVVVRSYFLLRGDPDLTSWDRSSPAPGLTRLPIPAFMWPADRAWCLTRDVDPHFASIGASREAISGLLTEDRIDVVVDDPATYPPRYCY